MELSVTHCLRLGFGVAACEAAPWRRYQEHMNNGNALPADRARSSIDNPIGQGWRPYKPTSCLDLTETSYANGCTHWMQIDVGLAYGGRL